MNGGPLRRTVVIRNPQGFHVRPAAAFAQAAARFQCQVHLTHGAQRVDGRRVLDLIMLAAEPGAELVLEVEGTDAAEALDVLAELLASDEPPDVADASVPKKG